MRDTPSDALGGAAGDSSGDASGDSRGAPSSEAQAAGGAIRALIVDDEPLARRGLRQLLAPHADVVVAGECGNGREALAALDALAPDLVFLDIQMPELDGFAVLRAAIAARGAERMPVTVFLTAYE